MANPALANIFSFSSLLNYFFLSDTGSSARGDQRINLEALRLRSQFGILIKK